MVSFKCLTALNVCECYLLFYSSPLNRCVLVCVCLEGECCRTSDGVVIRKGSGTQTSASGVTYTGEWDNDKVCVGFFFFYSNNYNI